MNDSSAHQTLISHVLQIWPTHQSFLEKAKVQISETPFAEELASMVLRVAGGHLDDAVKGYKWMCNMMTEEELEFRRTGHYRYSSFDEVAQKVYAHPDVMSRYMDGLLISQALWPNHVRAFQMYQRDFLPSVAGGRRHLEIGPGHGLLLYSAAKVLTGHIEAWDISASSLESTRHCLSSLNPSLAQVELRQVDFMKVPENFGYQFDSIVLSELLEHLEAPSDALEKVKRLVVPKGKLFINVPVNSPSIDHIFHFRTTSEVLDLIKCSGFKIDEHCFVPSGGYSLERAIKFGTTISCVVIASNQNEI